MRLEEIISMLQRNLMLGISFTFIVALVFLVGYRYIYLKRFAGNRRLTGKQLVVFLLFTVYVITVCALTLLSRGANYEGSVNLALFSSYRDAWYSFSVRDWQYIYFNIAMFVPLGFFLPLLHKRFNGIGWTLFAAVLFTGFIECVQYITAVGIFELDDLFNNVLGALIGFGLVKAFMVKSWSLRALSMLPLLVVVGISAGMFVYYEQKEFGNLSIVPATKLKMEDVEVSTTLKLSEKRPVATVYKAPSLTKEEAQQYAYTIFEKLQLDTSDIEIIDYQNEANYRYHGEPTYFVWLRFLDGSYELTDFSSFDVEQTDTDEATVKGALQQLNIIIPSEAQFKRVDIGQYEWHVEQVKSGHQLIDGTLRARYFEDGTVKSVYNQMVTYDQVKEVKLKSEQQAYDELLEGRFKAYMTDIQEIQIQQVKLDYMLDSKGFYHPIYVFHSVMDGQDVEIYIPGIE